MRKGAACPRWPTASSWRIPAVKQYRAWWVRLHIEELEADLAFAGKDQLPPALVATMRLITVSDRNH